MSKFSEIYEDASTEGKVLLSILAIIIWFGVTYLIKLLWNNLSFELFNLSPITYWQAMKINLLVLLFKIS